jgi:hypothetical protein
VRPIGCDRRHCRPCLRHPERYPLAGKRIDVPSGVADQKHSASDSVGDSLPEWAGPARSCGGEGVSQPLSQLRELVELLLERHPARA